MIICVSLTVIENIIAGRLFGIVIYSQIQEIISSAFFQKLFSLFVFVTESPANVEEHFCISVAQSFPIQSSFCVDSQVQLTCV